MVAMERIDECPAGKEILSLHYGLHTSHSYHMLLYGQVIIMLSIYLIRCSDKVKGKSPN